MSVKDGLSGRLSPATAGSGALRVRCKLLHSHAFNDTTKLHAECCVKSMKLHAPCSQRVQRWRFASLPPGAHKKH